jgi:hypothetical protein
MMKRTSDRSISKSEAANSPISPEKFPIKRVIVERFTQCRSRHRDRRGNSCNAKDAVVAASRQIELVARGFEQLLDLSVHRAELAQLFRPHLRVAGIPSLSNRSI